MVLDFGGQYNQLIARRVRELSVYSEMVPLILAMKKCWPNNPGYYTERGPESVHVENAPTCDPRIFEMGVPVLGICYGMQLLAQHFGGQVAGGQLRSMGVASCRLPGPRICFLKAWSWTCRFG